MTDQVTLQARTGAAVRLRRGELAQKLFDAVE